MVQPLWKTIWPFLIKFPYTYYQAIPLVGSSFLIHMKTYVCTKTHTQMFIVAFFTKLETIQKSPKV